MKKFVVLLLVVVLSMTALVSFAACKKDNNDVDIDDKGNIIPKPGTEATRITFWANCDSVELEVFRTIVKNFNEKYKGSIEVKLVPKTGSDYTNALGVSLGGSNPPDVFYVADNVYKAYAEMGYLYDITEHVEKSEIYNVEDMWENVSDRYKYDVVTGLSNTASSRFYGVPKDLGPTAIFYNETYFKGAGITVISVDADDLDAFNNGAADSRGKTKSEYGINGTVKEKGYFQIDGKYYFNNQVPMSWSETVECAQKVQNYMRNTLGKSSGYGYFTEWWFNYGWSVGGDCIQRIPTDDPAYRGYYYDFTLMDPTPNFIVADDVTEEVTVNGNKYKAGEIIAYTDKIDMSAYDSKADATKLAANRGSYQVTSEVLSLETQGKLNRLPSQKDAFVEFVRLASSTETTVSGNLKGYEITPFPQDIDGDSGKTNAFTNGQLAMLVDGRWNVTNFRQQMGTTEWDVAPLPMYKEYDAEGNITVHGIQAGHSGSVALCVSAKSKVPLAAWKFIEYCGSEEGQTLQAEAGFAIPLQKDLANSEVFLQSDQRPYNSRIFIDATAYEKAGDWWYLKDKKWIDDWANVLNGDVRNGKKTMEQFYECKEYSDTFKKLIDYALTRSK